MSEIVNTYLIDNPEVLIPMKRSEFYDEQIKVFKETGKPTRAVDVIHVLIFNSDGEIMIQKRSDNKNHNPGMFDKTIGGHVTHGNKYDYTVMVETVQELQTPSIVLRDFEEFKKTCELLSDYTETIAIINHGNTGIHNLPKILGGERIDILNRTHLYFGVYDGRTRPVDKESQGVLYYKYDKLLEDMKKNPYFYTEDLHFILEKNQKAIREFISSIRTLLKK